MTQSGQVLIAALLLVSAAVPLLVAIQAWRQRQADARLFAVVMLSGAIWLAGYAAELLFSTLDATLFAARVQYIGIALLPPFWMLFALRLTSKRDWVTPRLIAAATVIPAITILLAWTSGSHDLLWTSVTFDEDASATGLIVEYGPWFWVHTAYSYAALLGSNIALAIMFARALRLYRRQASLMLIGVLAPWIANIGYLLAGSETSIDPTPLALAFSGVLLAWGLFRWRLLDVKPVPRARSVESMRDGVIVLDHRFRIVDCNSSAAAMLGMDDRTILGRQIASAAREFAALQEDGGAAVHRVPVADPESPGAQRILEARVSAFNGDDPNGSSHRLVVLRDITEQDRAEQLLRAAESRYRTLIEQMPAVTYIREWSDRLIPTYISPQIQALLGYDAVAICSEEPPSWEQLIHLEDLEDVLHLHRRAAQSQSGFAAEYRMKTVTGQIVWVRDEAVGIGDEAGSLPHWQGVIVDITAQKRLETQLEHYAFYDTLTGLPNRALLLDRLRHSLSRVQREEKLVGVLFVDLDGFKIINDTLGHSAGDLVLQNVAQRLESNLRSGDTAGRLGGDEFVVVVESLDDADAVMKVAQRIIEGVRRPMTVGEQEVVVTASVGVRISTPGDFSPEEFLRDADIAMYWAKNQGRSRAVTFDSSMLAHRWNRLGLETELRAALRDEQMEVFYQPIVALRTGRLTGFEALLRWIHPERGELAPGEFIQAAEESGLMTQIDRWVLETACRQVADWQKRLPQTEDRPILTVSVNITPDHIQHPSILADIASALERSGLAPQQLMLEITENHTMRDVSTAGKRLEEITRLGPKVIIDDFGTGYSALAYLRQFSISGIKIDKSFVSGLGVRDDETSLVTAVVSLARSFNLQVTAEGIETRAQWADLGTLGADLGQGFLIARPLTAADIDAHIDSGDLSAIIQFPEMPRLRIVSGE